MAISLIGGIAGAGVGAIQSAVGTARGLTTDAVKVAYKLDVAVIFKYTILFFVIVGLLILAVQITRGVLIGIEQIGCGANHMFDSKTIRDRCSPFHEQTFISSVNWAWDIEWYLLCLWYLNIAVIVGLIAYEWIKRLLDLLLNIDRYFAKIDDWIYGRKHMFSDEALT